MIELQAIEVIMTWQFWLAAAACWVVCEVVKKIPGVPSWLIGVVNLVVGIILFCCLTGWTETNVVAGVLCSAMACYAYEFVIKIVESFENMGSIQGGER